MVCFDREQCFYRVYGARCTEHPSQCQRNQKLRDVRLVTTSSYFLLLVGILLAVCGSLICISLCNLYSEGSVTHDSSCTKVITKKIK